MNYIVISGLVVLLVAVVTGFRLGWELLQQNGRVLLRMEALEKRLEKIESAAANPSVRPAPPSDSKLRNANSSHSDEKSETDKSLPTSAATKDEVTRANRFGDHSLANSKIKRDGLKAGTPAPEFRLPRLDGGELALSDLRGRLVFLVFSSPHCGPCNLLAPKLERFHRKYPRLQIVMISRETPEANREKVNELGLAFPVVLQKQWEVSRDYAFFGTPVAYLIDSAGVIVADAAVGVDAVMELTTQARRMLRQGAEPPKRRVLNWSVRLR